MKKILQSDMILKTIGFLCAAILIYVSFSLDEIAVMNKVNNGFVSNSALYFEVQSDISVTPNEVMQFLDKESILYRKGMDINNIEIIGFGGESTSYPLQSGRQFHKQDLINNEKILSMSGVNSATSDGEIIARIGFSFPSLMDYMNFYLMPYASRAVLQEGIYLIDGSPSSIQRSYAQMMNHFANISVQDSIVILDVTPQGTYRMLNQQTVLQTIMKLMVILILCSFIGAVIYWLQKRGDLISLLILFGHEKIKIYYYLSKSFLQQIIPIFIFGCSIAVVAIKCTHGGQVVSSIPWNAGVYFLAMIACAEAILAIHTVKRG
jgi:hypothetical protein